MTGITLVLLVAGLTAAARRGGRRGSSSWGDRPQALARFVTWAGGSSARILVLPWASGEPRRAARRSSGAGLTPRQGVLRAVRSDARGKAAPLDEAKKATR